MNTRISIANTEKKKTMDPLTFIISVLLGVSVGSAIERIVTYWCNKMNQQTETNTKDCVQDEEKSSTLGDIEHELIEGFIAAALNGTRRMHDASLQTIMCQLAIFVLELADKKDHYLYEETQELLQTIDEETPTPLN